MTRPRGRPKLKDEEKRSEPVGIRLTKQLRTLLEESQQQTGAKSLSQEIEVRLWQSFTADSNIEKRFGGFATARLLEIIANRIGAIEVTAGGEHRWLDDRFTYDQVRTMIGIVLDHLKPRGRRTMPKLWRQLHPSLRRDFENMGQRHALEILAMLAIAMKEPMPDEMPPIAIYRAALPLGRRIRGSPVNEFEKILQQRQDSIERVKARHRKRRGRDETAKPKEQPK